MNRVALCLLLLPVFAAPALAGPPKKPKKPKVVKPKPTPKELKEIRWYVGQLGGKKHEFVRAKACDALASYGPKAEMAVRGLINAMKDSNERIASSACAALGKVGTYSKAAHKALFKTLEQTKRPELRRPAAEAIGDLGPFGIEGLQVLLATLEDEDVELRREAIRSLGKLGDEAAEVAGPKLEACMEDDDPGVQKAAAVSLTQLGIQSEAMVPLLQATVENTKAQLKERTQAAEALGKLGAKGKAAVPALVAVVEEEFKNHPGIPYAEQREKDHDAMRLAAVEALGNIGPDAAEAVSVLEAAAKKESLAEAAKEALKKIQAE